MKHKFLENPDFKGGEVREEIKTKKRRIITDITDFNSQAPVIKTDHVNKKIKFQKINADNKRRHDVLQKITQQNNLKQNLSKPNEKNELQTKNIKPKPLEKRVNNNNIGETSQSFQNFSKVLITQDYKENIPDSKKKKFEKLKNKLFIQKLKHLLTEYEKFIMKKIETFNTFRKLPFKSTSGEITDSKEIIKHKVNDFQSQSKNKEINNPIKTSNSLETSEIKENNCVIVPKGNICHAKHLIAKPYDQQINLEINLQKTSKCDVKKPKKPVDKMNKRNIKSNCDFQAFSSNDNSKTESNKKILNESSSSSKGSENQKSKNKIPLKMKGPCNPNKCKMKCSEKLSKEERQQIFTHYWNLSVNDRYKFIVFTVFRKLRSNDNYTLQYNLKSNKCLEKVCNKMYINTLNIKQQRIQAAFRKTKNDYDRKKKNKNI